jgi:hypothetical protein
MPFGIFSNQKFHSGYIFEILRIENVPIFYGHSECFTAFWNILWSFCNAAIVWYILHRFGILCQEKSGNPARK